MLDARYWFGLVLNTATLTVLCFTVSHMLRSARSGAPFVPSFGVRRLVRLAAVREGDVVVEMGSGDGRFCIAAARAGAAHAVGYEISWILVRAARLRSWLAGTSGRCTFRREDIRACDPSEATLAFLYLMPGITNDLAAGPLLRLKPGARVLSSCFPIELETHPGFRLLRSENLGFGSVGYLYERV